MIEQRMTPYGPATIVTDNVGPDRRAPASREEIEQRRRRYEQRRQDELCTAQERHDQIAGRHTDPTLLAVLAHHAPVLVSYEAMPVCDGCDLNGHDAEPPEWPCSTIRVVEGDA